MSGRGGYHTIYPPDGYNLFDGGKNSKFEKSIIEDNESPDCLNVIFDAGSVATRDGFRKINTASVGSFVCDGLYTRRGTGNAETMVGFFGGSAWNLVGTSMITIGSAQSVFTAGVRVGSAQMENHAFFGNGGVIPYKWNGIAWTRHGVYPPSSNPTSAATGAAGNPNGAYTYKITYVNSQAVEGNPSVATTTLTVASTQISLTSIPVAPQSWGVAARRIYRTVTSGTTFLRLTTISDNTTTTFTDNVADAALGVAAPDDQGVPPNYSAIIFHQRRLFMNDPSNPGLVWYSDLDEPFTVGALNFIAIGDQSTDFCTGFGVQENSLVCFGEKSPWLIYMEDTDPANWRVIKGKSDYSSKSPYGIFNYNNQCAFPAVQNHKFVGMAALAGAALSPDVTNLTVETAGSELKSQRIEPDMFDIQDSFAGNISSIVFKNKAYIAMTKGSGNTMNNRVYVMDFSISNLSKKQKESWVPWTGLNVAQFTIYSNELYYGSSTANGFVYKQNIGVYTDDGSAINSYYWTKEFPGKQGEESNNKDFRYANLLVDTPGAYYMNVGFRNDSDSGSGTDYQVDVTSGSSLWGVMVWGTDLWGGGRTQRDVRFFLAGSRGKRIQYKFSNQNVAGQKFKVHWMNFTYNLKGPR